MIEVRRDDGELCGYVATQGDRWQARAVFGAVLGSHASEGDARRDVLERGLASLADRWTLVDATTGEEQVVCIQQASPDEVTLALDYYSVPGVASLTISRDELARGRWRLEHRT